MKAGYKSKFEQAWSHWETEHPQRADRPTIQEALSGPQAQPAGGQAVIQAAPQPAAAAIQEPQSGTAGAEQRPTDGAAQAAAAAPSSGAPPPAGEPKQEVPPAKRRKVEDKQDATAEGQAAEAAIEAPSGRGRGDRAAGSRGSTPSQTPAAKVTGKRTRGSSAEEAQKEETPEEKKARMSAKRDAAKAAQKTLDDAQAAVSAMSLALNQADFIIDAIKTDPAWRTWAPNSKAEARMLDAKRDLEGIATPGSFIKECMMKDMDTLRAEKGEEVFQKNIATLPMLVEDKTSKLKDILKRMNDLHALHMDE